MVTNKHISKIIIALMAVAVIVCLLAVGFADKLSGMLGGTGVKMEYESQLFDTDEIISVDIQMDEETWEEMLKNAMSEEYYVCDVVINGQKLYNVAIRPKGNTSLSSIAMDPDTDRYSLKLEFDHFVDGQTCYGLDKLILNNNYADATNMKEAIIYDMYQYLDADASLYNYASVSLNGEYRGVYLALEGVEESFMLRNYGTQDGELYKPESMGMGGGDDNGGMSMPGGDFEVDPENMPEMPEGDFEFDPENMPEGFDFDPGNMPQMPGGGGFGPGNKPEGGFGPSEDEASDDTSEAPSGDRSDMGDFEPSEDKPEMGSGGGPGGFSMGGNGGANLNYTDDDLDSYSTIWDGEVTGTGKADHKRVVKALKNISEGNEIEKYLDVDNILKYMAVHTFAVNMDSLSGNMAHNYYLYEYDGQLNIIPWDYNLSFGGMGAGGGDATEMINDSIDTPFSGTEFFDALLENEEYLEKYHSYLQQLVDEYVYGGRFDEVYNRIRNQIDSLVETDPTAFYSYDEYLTAADMLYQTVMLRAESIDGQLNGMIPSTDEGQRQDSSSLVDGSSIDIEAMGQFDMGGGSDRSPDN
ncbi:MAG: CotH kinase family protein [Lachnospiraceae bacterium]|nr:CotH kinase family protein [Lachnospiraceae bacterium]